MLQKLESLETKYNELNDLLSNSEVIADQSRYQKYAKAYADLTEIVSIYRDLRAAIQGIDDAKNMLREEPDDEFKAMLLAEIEDLEAKKNQLEQRVKILLLPTDPNDEKSVIMEILSLIHISEPTRRTPI